MADLFLSKQCVKAAGTVVNVISLDGNSQVRFHKFMPILSDRAVSLGRFFFAVGLVGFGILQFIYGDFVPGRAPAWPSALPGRLCWAYASGAVLIMAAAAILSGKKARWAALLVGTMVLVWAFFRHLPGLLAHPDAGVITNAGKALVLFGGAFAVAGSLPAEAAGAFSRIINSKDAFLCLGRFCLGIFMIVGGVEHFIYADFVATLVPAWIPGAHFWTYFAGVALIAGGAGLMLPKTAYWAALLSGLMIFLWVLLLHIPRALAASEGQRRNEWTAVFEALAFSGIAFVLTRRRTKRGLDPR